jgi:hypothetical protein
MAGATRVSKYDIMTGGIVNGTTSSVVTPVTSMATFYVSGITTATVTIETAYGAGLFVSTGLTFTADGVGTVTGLFDQLRAKITAYTSGTINVSVIC